MFLWLVLQVHIIASESGSRGASVSSGSNVPLVLKSRNANIPLKYVSS